MEALVKKSMLSRGVDDTEEKKSTCLCSEVLSLFFWSRDQTHVWHLQTENKSEHKLLQNHYEALVDFADRFAETYMGHFPDARDTIKVTRSKEIGEYTDKCTHEHFAELTKEIDKIREKAEKPSLINIIDDIDEHLNKCLYLTTLR